MCGQILRDGMLGRVRMNELFDHERGGRDDRGYRHHEKYFAQTHLAQRFVRGLEGSVLSMLPGYEYLKQAGTSVLGFGEMEEHPVVLAHLGDTWRIGVQTDHVGEDLVAVFLPNSPNPLSGSVFFVAADRVRPLEGSLASAIACLRRCGTGSGTLLSGVSVGAPPPASGTARG